MSAALQTLAVILLPLAIPFVKRQWLQLQQYKHTTPRAFSSLERRQLTLISVLAAFYVVLIVRELLLPEDNVYRLTNSRLAISMDVLRRRCQTINVDLPETLWTALEAPEMKLAYLRLGPDSLQNCAWCTMESINTYFYYTMSSVALAYLAHLAVLSSCTSHRGLAAAAVALVFGLEAYARAGGVDKFNAQTKTSADILFVASYASLFRQCFFLWTAAISSLKIWFDAQFPIAQPDLNHVRADLISTLETLRASNAMRRAIGDNEPLRDHTVSFWTRNEAATKKLDAVEDLYSARHDASERFGNVKHETAQVREFISRTTGRLSN